MDKTLEMLNNARAEAVKDYNRGHKLADGYWQNLKDSVIEIKQIAERAEANLCYKEFGSNRIHGGINILKDLEAQTQFMRVLLIKLSDAMTSTEDNDRMASTLDRIRNEYLQSLEMDQEMDQEAEVGTEKG